MKTIHWILSSCMALVVLALVAVGGAAMGYAYALPATQPEPQIQVVTVEVPKIIDRVVEKIVTQEVIITATPAPVAVLLPPVIQPTPIPPEPTATPKTCTNVAYIEMQTGDKIQGDAMKVGQKYRLNTTLVNAGTCDWIGYKLVSINGDPLQIDVPITYAGQAANFTVTEGIVREIPLHYMLVMQDEVGNVVPFASGGTLDGCMPWTLETLTRTAGFGQLMRNSFSSRLSCGAGG